MRRWRCWECWGISFDRLNYLEERGLLRRASASRCCAQPWVGGLVDFAGFRLRSTLDRLFGALFDRSSTIEG
jgi:hypothetical protein